MTLIQSLRNVRTRTSTGPVEEVRSAGGGIRNISCQRYRLYEGRQTHLNGAVSSNRLARAAGDRQVPARSSGMIIACHTIASGTRKATHAAKAETNPMQTSGDNQR